MHLNIHPTDRYVSAAQSTPGSRLSPSHSLLNWELQATVAAQCQERVSHCISPARKGPEPRCEVWFPLKVDHFCTVVKWKSPDLHQRSGTALYHNCKMALGKGILLPSCTFLGLSFLQINMEAPLLCCCLSLCVERMPFLTVMHVGVLGY